MKCLLSIISLLLLATVALAQETKPIQFPPKRTSDPATAPRAIAQPIPLRTSGDARLAKSTATIPLRKADGASPTTAGKNAATVNNPAVNTVQPASGKTTAPYPSALSVKQASDLQKQKETNNNTVPAVTPKQGQ